MSVEDLRPKKSKHYLVLSIFCVAIVAFQITINSNFVKPTLWEIIIIPAQNSRGWDLATLLYNSGSLISAIASFAVARRYIGSAMFTKAYFCLGLGFSFWFIGDMFFFYDSYIHALPSWSFPLTFNSKETFVLHPADFIYLGIYPNQILHLYLNTNWFSKNKLKITKKSLETKFYLFGVPTIGAIIFFLQVSSVNSENITTAINFESIFGALNAVGASVTLGLVFWGVRVFKASALAPAWTLLLLGIFFSTVGDYLYYQVESYNTNYQIYSLSTTFYLLCFMIMTYGLYKHMKIL